MHGFIMSGCELAVEFCDEHYMILRLVKSVNVTKCQNIEIKIKVDTNFTYCCQEIKSWLSMETGKEDWWIIFGFIFNHVLC